MEEKEKLMQYANFNITFGKNNAPMLEHFEDIIYPAFLSGFRRGREGQYPNFYFNSVEIKEVDGDFVLVGNFIKEDRYDIHTTMQDGKLVSSPAEVPTAPYSRFIIFLKNHRMVLVRNEKKSPDVRSFQATITPMLKRYIKMLNGKLEKEYKLPNAAVNIIDIPLKYDIARVLRDVQKINSLKFRFVPLNNDVNPAPFGVDIDKELKRLQGHSANVSFTSPSSKEAVIELIDQTTSNGLAAATLKVQDAQGNSTTIKEDQFSTNRKIYLEGDLQSRNDQYIIEQAKKDEVINTQSQANERLYNRFKEIIQKLKS